MKFQTKYNRNKRVYEKPSGKSGVETAGYIPAKQKIESFFLAGARLIQSRKEQYDFPPGTEPDENYYDPTRNKWLDRVDIDTMEKALEARIETRIAAQKQEAIPKDKESSKKASEGLKNDSAPE